MKQEIRIGTVVRLPWWAGSPRAVVVALPRSLVPARIVLLGIGRGVRGRLMTVRRDRVQTRAHYVGEATPFYRVPCACRARSCNGVTEFRDALALHRKLSR